jgi:hypothetical protein
MRASLWPPPAKCTARIGFQPTNAAANAARFERRAARIVASRTAAAAATLYVHAAASGESTAASGSDASENAGP